MVTGWFHFEILQNQELASKYATGLEEKLQRLLNRYQDPIPGCKRIDGKWSWRKEATRIVAKKTIGSEPWNKGLVWRRVPADNRWEKCYRQNLKKEKTKACKLRGMHNFRSAGKLTKKNNNKTQARTMQRRRSESCRKCGTDRTCTDLIFRRAN